MGGAMRSFGRLRRFGCAACVDWPFTGIAIEVLQSCGGVSTFHDFLVPSVHTVHCASTYDSCRRSGGGALSRTSATCYEYAAASVQRVAW